MIVEADFTTPLISSSEAKIEEHTGTIMEPVNRTLGKECKFTGFLV